MRVGDEGDTPHAGGDQRVSEGYSADIRCQQDQKASTVKVVTRYAVHPRVIAERKYLICNEWWDKHM